MGRLRGSAAREPCCPGGLTTREGPAAPPGGSDPRRELKGCCGGGGLRLGGASGLPVAGTRTCIRSPRASQEPLSLCASPRQLLGRGPRTCWWVGGGRPLGAFPAAPPTLGWERPEGAWDWGPGRAAQARPGGWGGRRGAGARLCLSPLGSTSDPGRPGISGRGVGCVSDAWAPSREAPPAAAAAASALAAALVSGGGRSPREAEEGRRQKVPRDTKVRSAGVELRGRAAQLRGEGRGAGPPEVGEEAAVATAFPAPWRRRGCAWVGSGRRRGPRVRSRPRQRSGQPPAGESHPWVWVRAEVEGMWETQRTDGEGHMGRGRGGAAKYCRLRHSGFSQRFCAWWFCSAIQLDSSRFAPSHHPLPATLTLLWFSPRSPRTSHHSFLGKQYFAFSLGNVC